MNQAEIKRRQAEEIANILNLITIFILGNRMGDGGITYMTAAVSACTLVGIAVSGSLADALGKLLRSRRNKGQYRNILAMRKSAMLFHGALGLAGTLFLILCAGGITEGIFRISYSRFIIIALAPVVLLRTVSCAVQGYFQGEAAELPRAVSGILRRIFLLGLGLLFGNMLGDYGEKVGSLLREENFASMYCGIGIALAAGITELFIILFLAVLFKGSRRGERKLKQDGMYTGDSAWDCIRSLCIGRWPQFLTELLLFLPLFLGLVLFGRKAEEPGAIYRYDAYAGRYLVICGVILSLVSALVLPVMGRIFLHFRREEGRLARTAFQSGVHICLVHGIFLSVYVAVMAAQIASFLGGEDSELVKQMLQGGSWVIVFASLSFFCFRFLTAMGKKYFLLGAVGTANVIFVITLMASSKTGVLSLVYGGEAGTFALCVMLAALSYRQLRMQMDWLSVLVLPAGAGGVSGLVCMLLSRLLAGLGDFPAILVSFALSGLLYWTLLLVLRNFKEQELEVFPGGRLLGMIGQKMHLYS